ncbi:hypothetical protein QJS10_CPB14g01034 [Acorus calamus]|uniref:DNA primase n=1 Tax=Acorus calamus TaxID=4465 RepID=A0AAV9DF17_ACOCL|nr:hypothetical protein QJS10_CPB14g01034 [Acorus calamus]
MEEESCNGRDDMVIDGHELVQQQVNTIPKGFNLDHLKVYYDGKHPGCDPSYFGRREFSFTLENDIYLRFQSFNSATELEHAIREKCPFKINIGPVYSVDPAKGHAYAQGGDNVFTPMERELIFDIDMSDYDDVRYCCSGADVCLDCWPLMTVAIKVMDRALRDDFGFDHILWVYSGRRGVHCWVCDRRARRLTNEQRAAVADYFRVYKVGSENNAKKVSLTSAVLHPFLADKIFEDVLKKLSSPTPTHGLIWRFGRVCVPIDPDRCEDFDPTAVQALSEEEIESSYNAKLQPAKNSLTW